MLDGCFSFCCCARCRYGRIRDIDIKSPARPPAFAFISFEDRRDAEDAVYGRDGYNYDGYRLRVELSRGDRSRGGEGGRGSAGGARAGGRRTEYGVVVSNLPRSCSWQDLKDFMRKAGDVVYTDVDKNGEGVVEFSNRDDMENALRTLDDTEFKNYNDSAYIRVKRRREASGDANRGREKARSPSRSRSPRSRSRDRKRSPSRSRSHSPARHDKRAEESDGDRRAHDEDAQPEPARE